MSTVQEQSARLAAAVRAGDRTAETQIVERFGPALRFILARELPIEVVEDLYQEAFRILIERLRGSGLNEPEKLAAFLQGIVRRLILQYRRREARFVTGDGVVERFAVNETNAYDDASRGEELRLLSMALERLSVSRDREVLRRRYLRDEDKHTICEDLDLTPDQFDRVLYRARQRLRHAARSLGIGSA